MTKVSLVGAYGYWNYGDDLLAWIFANYIRELIPDVSLTISAPYNGKYYICNMTGSDDALPLTSAKFWLKKGKEEFKSSDFVIFGGGGILYDYPELTKFKKKDLRRASALFYLTSLLSCTKNGSILIHGIGIGPLSSKYSQILSELFIKKSTYLSVRDHESANFAKKAGMNVDIIPDPSFILAKSFKKEISTKSKIGFVFRKWEHYSIFKNDEEIKKIFEEIEKKTGFEVVPISLRTGEFDNIAGKKVIEWDPRKMNPIEFAELLSEFSVLLTMRLHAMNVAACYGVPSVAIGLDPKIIKSAHSLGLENYICLPTASMDEIVDKVVHLNNNEKIKSSLKKVTFEYSKEVEASFNKLRLEIEKKI